MSQLPFTKEGLEELKKMAKEGATQASDSLSKLINQNITLKTVGVKSVLLEEVATMIGNPEDIVTAIIMDIGGEVSGEILLIYPQQTGLNIADLLSKRPLGFSQELSQLDKAALQESGNIIAGSFLTALSDYLSINMIESTPDITTNMLKAILNTVVVKFSQKDQVEAIAFEIDFSMSAKTKEAIKVVSSIHISAFFVMIMDIPSCIKILDSLKNISGGKDMGGGRA